MPGAYSASALPRGGVNPAAKRSVNFNHRDTEGTEGRQYNVSSVFSVPPWFFSDTTATHACIHDS